MKIKIISYKKAQVFKKDYVRKGGNFLRFDKFSGNHSAVCFEVFDGDEFDARGSIYCDGVTKWNSTDCQSWAKFVVRDGKLIPMDYSGHEIVCPKWLKVVDVENESEVVGDEIRSLCV